MKDNNFIYIWLGILTIILSAILAVVYPGRWECLEYEYVCEECEMEGSGVIPTHLGELGYKWHVDRSNVCYCTSYKERCVKEAFVRDVK